GLSSWKRIHAAEIRCRMQMRGVPHAQIDAVMEVLPAALDEGRLLDFYRRLVNAQCSVGSNTVSLRQMPQAEIYFEDPSRFRVKIDAALARYRPVAIGYCSGVLTHPRG